MFSKILVKARGRTACWRIRHCTAFVFTKHQRKTRADIPRVESETVILNFGQSLTVRGFDCTDLLHRAVCGTVQICCIVPCVWLYRFAASCRVWDCIYLLHRAVCGTVHICCIVPCVWESSGSYVNAESETTAVVQSIWRRGTEFFLRSW
jgi:hypothetical protein